MYIVHSVMFPLSIAFIATNCNAVPLSSSTNNIRTKMIPSSQFINFRAKVGKNMKFSTLPCGSNEVCHYDSSNSTFPS